MVPGFHWSPQQWPRPAGRTGRCPPALLGARPDPWSRPGPPFFLFLAVPSPLPTPLSGGTSLLFLLWPVFSHLLPFLPKLTPKVVFAGRGTRAHGHPRSGGNLLVSALAWAVRPPGAGPGPKARDSSGDLGNGSSGSAAGAFSAPGWVPWRLGRLGLGAVLPS